MTARRIGVLGTGRVALALGKLLVDAGEAVLAVAGRNHARAEKAAAFLGRAVETRTIEELPALVDHVLIAVSDDAIATVAELLAGSGFKRGVALHTSGIYGEEVLTPLISAGACAGALHPLQTVATPEQGVRSLPGAYFGVTAEGSALEWACRIVELLQGKILRIPGGSRVLYHGAAVLASNSLVALLDAAVLMLRECGIDGQEARRALSPLIRNSVDNTLKLGPEAALTGPIKRGDVETLRRHLEALGASPQLQASVRELFLASARHILDLAVRAGLDSKATLRLEAMLQREQVDVG